MNIIDDFKIDCPNDIYQAINRIEKENKIPYQPQYRPGYIFDEDQSVKWNKEEIVRRNNQLDEDRTNAAKIKSQSYANLDSAVMCYLLDGYNITISVAQKVIGFAQCNWEDDWWNYIDTMGQFAEDVIRMTNGD